MCTGSCISEQCLPSSSYFDLTVEVEPGSDSLHLSRISNIYELWSSALNEEYLASAYISNDIT